MKSKKNIHSKVGSRLISIVVCLAIAITTLTFGIFNIGATGSTVPSADEPRGEIGVRFVQIAAGEDFAIGLTYDGKLYGWSLRTDNRSGQGVDGPRGNYGSLGQYYTTVPTKIDVPLRNGPRSGSNIYSWSYSGYHSTTSSERRGERIKQIATTRTTAAFITTFGHVYTWGYDGDMDVTHNGTTRAHKLLLRDPTDESDSANNLNEPYIINYGYYGGTAAGNNTITVNREYGLTYLIPTTQTDSTDMTEMSIAGGEYSYTVLFKRGTNTAARFYSYSWGSMLYENTITNNDEGSRTYSGTTPAGLNDSTARRIYQLPYSSDTSGNVYAGGYTIGINLAGGDSTTRTASTTSLMLRGKNFITTVDATGDGDTYSVTNTTAFPTMASNYYYVFSGSTEGSTTDKATKDVRYNSNTYSDAIIGARVGHMGGDSNYVVPDAEGNNGANNAYYNNDLIYGRQSGSYNYSTTPLDTLIYNSNGTALNENANLYLQVSTDAVSLGNDIGYGISNGTLYSWGDNAYGQNGANNASSTNNITAPTAVLSITGNNGDIFDVAAGKQLSPANGTRAFYSDTFDSDNKTFKEEVKNDSAYITGILKKDGSASQLWAWSDKHQAPQQITYGGVSSGSVNHYNQFIKVFSGYGNSLFAITRLGQAVMIKYTDSGYVQTIYDQFADTLGSTKTNWSVVSETSARRAQNTVKFDGGSKATAANPTPDLGMYTITVNDSGIILNGSGEVKTSAETGITLNNSTNAYAGGTRNSLVTLNNAGHEYRIVTPDDAANIITVPTSSNGLSSFISGTSDLTTVRGTPITSFDPVFYWTAADRTFSATTDKLTDKINTSEDSSWTTVGSMFKYKFEKVDGDYNITGLTIQPLQSTQGGTIKVEFYIGRYATTGGDTHNSETQLFFDYELCSVDFIIGNTPAYKNYEAYDNAADGNASIPLLDSNNDYNKAYSIAVQNVSDGIDELIEQFFDNDSTLKNNIITDITAKDNGFPAESRVERGRLSYYLNEKDLARYDNTYNYFFIDRDADFLDITPDDASTGVIRSMSINGSSIKATRVAITVSASIPDTAITEGATSKLQDITYNFNNKYGLYNIGITESEGTFTLRFSYLVVKFEALGSTGPVKYEAGGGVTDYQTIGTDADRTSAQFSINFEEKNVYGNNFVVDMDKSGASRPAGNVSPGLNIVNVFAQPSLIANGGTINGNSQGGSNTIEKSYEGTISTVAGNTSAPFVINLTEFVPYPGDYIMFSYNDSNSYTDFNSQFPDETGMLGNDHVVTLTQTAITVKPTTTHALKFSVTIQRFHATSVNQSGVFNSDNAFADGNEKITVTFTFSTFNDFTFAWKGVQLDTIPGGSGSIDILGEAAAAFNYGTPLIDVGATGVSAAQRRTDYTSKIYMSQLKSSNTSVLSVQSFERETRTSFNYTATNSGTVVVSFVLTLYGKSLYCSMTLNVSATTYINSRADAIQLIDVSYVYVNTLLTEVKRANAAFTSNIDDFGILYDDPEAIYFTDSDGAVCEDIPKWIKSVTFVDTDESKSNPRMRIEINANENDTTGTYCLHVRYINKESNVKTYAQAEEEGMPIIETAQWIVSSRRIAQGEEGEVLLTIRIDTDNFDGHTESSTSNWYLAGESNGNPDVRVPVEYLLARAGITNADTFKIYLVYADTKAGEFFNYGFDNSGKFVSIKPLRNTPLDSNGVHEAYTVNVSARSTENEDTYVVSFRISVTGISETLSKEEYTKIWLVAFFSSFGLMFIIFLIRMIVYWRRRAKQRTIIKRNQELIKLRDRVHNKSSAATREQMVKSKLKMQDPKYAKMVNDMRKERQGEASGGIVVDNGFAFSEPAGAAAVAGKKGKKAKPGKKKSIAELKAELEAKKMAFAKAQNMEPQPPFAADVGAVPVDGQPFDAAAAPFDMGGGFASPVDSFATQDIDASGIIFDAPDGNGEV